MAVVIEDIVASLLILLVVVVPFTGVLYQVEEITFFLLVYQEFLS